MHKGTIWITRSYPAAQKSAQAWQLAGFQTYINPVIRIGIPEQMPKPLEPEAILLITSQNALRMLEIFTDRRDWTVMTVGDASADYARQIGFVDVLSASGNGQDLLNLVKKIFKPKDGRLFIHASGGKIRVDLAQRLTKLGYQARREIYYNNEGRRKLDVSAAPPLTHIALYSPMAARLVRPYAGRVNRARTISISENTDRALGERYENRRIIATHPSEEAMIHALSA